jgi:glycosyltransferase involved in cell wall biosynthesis
MRIGIDARELCGRPTGVGRYLSGLLREWTGDDAARRHEFVLYASAPIAMSLDARRFPTRIVPGHPGTVWEQFHLPRAVVTDHLDVWFAPGYTAPLNLHVPTVVAIHDLSFAAHPEWFRFREGIRRRWLTRRAAADASAIVTISEFSKRELVDRLDVTAAKIHVIPPGITNPASARTQHERASAGQAATRNPQSAIRNTNVLYVGSIFNRRHVPDLIRAFAPIARSRPAVALDIVGDNRTYPREDLRRTIDSEGLVTIVQWHEYVTDAQLHELYAHAGAFAFLSEYEGLGLTPLEALAAGVPAVLLDTAVARESCGDAAVYVPGSDLPATTRALEAVLFDDTTRSRLLAAAPAALAKYSWPRAARETLAVIEKVANRPKPRSS